MKKTNTNPLSNRIRNIFHAANMRLKRLYDEFSDILDTDEDRLSLQFNGLSHEPERRISRKSTGNHSLKK